MIHVTQALLTHDSYDMHSISELQSEGMRRIAYIIMYETEIATS